MTALNQQQPKIYGPFLPYNSRGLPIAMKNGIPAWIVKQPHLYRKDER
jgi:hypothetical protein